VASWPYAAKLAWSPVVDSTAFPGAAGPRKSWIVPVQLASAALMLARGPAAAAAVARGDVAGATAFFLALVALAATQDVAVDGWALTLLSRARVGYASTCQTLGTNASYFLSFTALLALGDGAFCERWLGRGRGAPPLLTLDGYLRFWGLAYLAVTAFVAFATTERRAPPGEPEPPAADRGKGGGAAATRSAFAEVRAAYAALAAVAALPSVRQLAVVLVTCRLAVLPAEAVAPLALAAKGVSPSALAALVLLQLPAELAAAFVAGAAAARGSAMAAWGRGYWARLAAAAATTAVVAALPDSTAAAAAAPTSSTLALLAALGLATAAAAALQFTCLGALYARVGDPAMGGAYLTLLNTIANIGLTLPKAAAFAAVDVWGLQTVSLAALGVGVGLGVWYRGAVAGLEALPLSAWRAGKRVDG
jgi:hypothetical protein